jgi:hypothetical protein
MIRVKRLALKAWVVGMTVLGFFNSYKAAVAPDLCTGQLYLAAAISAFAAAGCAAAYLSIGQG